MKRRDALRLMAAVSLLGPAPGQAQDQDLRSSPMKQEVKTDRAPKAIGPYSQAIIAGGFVFASGQIPINPATGELNTGSFEDQARQVLQNLSGVLEAAGCTPADVVKTTVFLQDMNDFSRMNAVYGEFFQVPYPARAAVQAARLPRDARIEIEAIALAKARP